MINIKSYGVPKKGTSSSKSSSTTNIGGDASLADSWFYYNNDYDAVCCRYNFYSVGSVSANGIIPDEQGNNEMIVDNLTSTATDKALSANQGRVLKGLIDNIQTGGGGGVPSTISWANVTDKPSTFTPSSHTHSISDVTNLQNTLDTVSATASNASSLVNSHASNSNIHLSQSQINKLNSLTEAQFTKLAQLLDMITINTVAATITVDGSILTTNDVTASI